MPYRKYDSRMSQRYLNQKQWLHWNRKFDLRFFENRATASQADNWIQTVINDNGECDTAAAYSRGLAVQVECRGPTVGSHLALFCIHQINWVNSRSDYGMTTAS